MESADVLVVGGGPAGSTCARELRAGGADVVVLDRARFPRDKPCAGWVTPRVLETLELDAADYARRRVFQPFFGFRVGWIDGPSVVTEYGRPVSFGLRRWELDKYLLTRSGARLRECAQVDRFTRDGDTWVADGGIRAPIVVGAGGQFCPVARHLDGRPSGASLVVAQQVEFLMDGRQRSSCRVVPEVPELYFSRDLEGYGWCVRKGDWLNVGLGLRREAGLTRHVAGFLRWITAAGRVPEDTPRRWRGHAYRLYEGPAPRVVGDGMLLVGDAAGLAAAASGEGIGPAVQSGLLAARAILAAPADHRDGLRSYAPALEKLLGARRPRRRLPPALVRLGAPVLSTRWFARHVVLDPVPGPCALAGRPRRAGPRRLRRLPWSRSAMR